MLTYAFSLTSPFFVTIIAQCHALSQPGVGYTRTQGISGFQIKTQGAQGAKKEKKFHPTTDSGSRRPLCEGDRIVTASPFEPLNLKPSMPHKVWAAVCMALVMGNGQGFYLSQALPTGSGGMGQCIHAHFADIGHNKKISCADHNVCVCCRAVQKLRENKMEHAAAVTAANTKWLRNFVAAFVRSWIDVMFQAVVCGLFGKSNKVNLSIVLAIVMTLARSAVVVTASMGLAVLLVLECLLECLCLTSFCLSSLLSAWLKSSSIENVSTACPPQRPWEAQPSVVTWAVYLSPLREGTSTIAHDCSLLPTCLTTYLSRWKRLPKHGKQESEKNMQAVIRVASYSLALFVVACIVIRKMWSSVSHLLVSLPVLSWSGTAAQLSEQSTQYGRAQDQTHAPRGEKRMAWHFFSDHPSWLSESNAMYLES